MTKELYYEDFEPGQKFEAGPHTMTREAIIDYATQWDPQPMHTDEEGAKHSSFGTLVASGWHTASASMRMKIDSPMSKVAGGLIGMGIENMRWPRPVYPGDSLRVVVTVLEKRVSNSKPGKGVVKYKVETFNQKNELVMDMKTAVIVPLRKA